MIFSLFILYLVLPAVVSASTPKNQTGFFPEDDVDVWIDGWGWHHWWWTGLDTSDRIYVDIEVTSAGGIDFFICDQENWDIWESGGTADVYSLLENRGSISVTFNVPYSGTWHVVFSNDDLLTQKHIEGYIGLSPLFIPVGIDPSLTFFILFAVIFFVSIAAWEGYKRTQKPKMEEYRPEMPLQISQEPTRQHPTIAPTNYCPYCGTPKQSSTARFCATCGRAFEGPDIG